MPSRSIFQSREQAGCLNARLQHPSLFLKVSQVVLNEMRGVLYYTEKESIRSDIYKYNVEVKILM